MPARAGATVLALPPSVIADRPVATLEDLDRTLEPDAVWVLGPEREPQAFARARSTFAAPAFHPPLETAGNGPLSRQVIDGGVGGETASLEVAVTPGLQSLQAAPESVSRTLAVDTDLAALVCDDVTTTTRPTALETDLEGTATVADAFPTGEVTTLLTGSQPAGYDALWHLEPDTGAVRDVDHETIGGVGPLAADCVSVRVRGAGPAEGYGNGRSIASLQVTPGGVTSVDTHDVTDYGLEAVTGIGPKTADRLADRGVTTRAELLETPVETLADLPNVSRERARRMRQHATVLEVGEPRRLTDESLPGADWHEPPLCLDIETDGLSPTIIWQIGVYDPASDSYQTFVERGDPSDPGPVLEAFCDWLLGMHPNRALLTWNGWRFDYRHLGAFIAKHVPYYTEEWESIPKFDLYLWAVTEEHALLPGRTNELEVVADALGYEGAGTGLDGARTAAAYQRFMRTGAELEWERHEAYCEDDCRALWHVYERLRDAPRADDVSPANGAPADDDTEQTGLGDF
ncbi:ribonuclease H-like domain-containing protein [Natronolimnohabitans sp. A-GB9]|uniref:ribonuclease H-like domain-containing protein n=1 Tax=Natronolimnohabitans sp. A-GB9 TaxID=3069757 RepID=UPI0027B8393E|nr:ribonuclease H-like domain-containing protein [Natronolimnohabitans sp. A-GB9]MDQ2048976.1 ribonuclease H-like domain-containing protein [Natronolimnohabitans sp. A-GB9]